LRGAQLARAPRPRRWPAVPACQPATATTGSAVALPLALLTGSTVYTFISNPPLAGPKARRDFFSPYTPFKPHF